MTAPDLVHGVWLRRWVTVDGSERFETQHVVWLQAGPAYADVRVPFHGGAEERCFTGRSGWDGVAYRWTHRIDLEGPNSPAADDTGELTWEGGVLFERGVFPTGSGPVTYEEGWVRAPGADGPWQVFEAPGAGLVRVGDHAITVVDRRAFGGGFGACYRVRGEHRWEVELAIGDVATLPAPGEVPSGWRCAFAGDASVVMA
jgi:hypothetical protein